MEVRLSCVSILLDPTFHYQCQRCCDCQGCRCQRIHRGLLQAPQEGQQDQDARRKYSRIFGTHFFGWLYIMNLAYSGPSTLRLLVTRISLLMTATGSTSELLPLPTNSTLEARLASLPSRPTTVVSRETVCALLSTTRAPAR